MTEKSGRVWKWMVLGSVCVLLCASTMVLAQAPQGGQGGPPAAGAAPAGTPPAGNSAPAPDPKLFKPAQSVDGTWEVTLVLPRAVIKNYIVLCSNGKTLRGALREVPSGNLIGASSDGAVSDAGFLFDAQAGPGHPYFAGSIVGDEMVGRVSIDKLTNDFRGKRSDKKLSCEGTK